MTLAYSVLIYLIGSAAVAWLFGSLGRLSSSSDEEEELEGSQHQQPGQKLGAH